MAAESPPIWSFLARLAHTGGGATAGENLCLPWHERGFPPLLAACEAALGHIRRRRPFLIILGDLDHSSAGTGGRGMTQFHPLPARDEWLPHERPMDCVGHLQTPMISRYSDRPLGLRERLFGVSGTASICVLILCACFFSWQMLTPPHEVHAPLVATFDTLAAPPEPRVEVMEGPKQQPQQEEKAAEAKEPPVTNLATPLSRPMVTPNEAAPLSQQTVTQVTQSSTPKAIEAPPAPRLASSDNANWQSRLLAHLEQHRRYPAISMSRREEGVVYVKFTMNRRGLLLSSKIMQTSGSARLDRAALDTLKRAQPLPAIPDDMPDPLELTVPVEFFIS